MSVFPSGLNPDTRQQSPGWIHYTKIKSGTLSVDIEKQVGCSAEMFRRHDFKIHLAIFPAIELHGLRLTGSRNRFPEEIHNFPADSDLFSFPSKMTQLNLSGKFLPGKKILFGIVKASGCRNILWRFPVRDATESVNCIINPDGGSRCWFDIYTGQPVYCRIAVDSISRAPFLAPGRDIVIAFGPFR